MTKQKKSKKKAAAPPASTEATTAVAELEATCAVAPEPEAADEQCGESQPQPKRQRGKKHVECRTLAELAERYLENLAEIGKSRGTCFSYSGELVLAAQWLGAETKLTDLSPALVQGFFECPAVTLTRTGRPKSPLSIAKTQRVLRQALVFAVGAGWIEVAPLPEMTKAA